MGGREVLEESCENSEINLVGLEWRKEKGSMAIQRLLVELPGRGVIKEF